MLRTVVILMFCLLLLQSGAVAQPSVTLSQPVSYKNLTIYFILDKKAPATDTYVALATAVKDGRAIVHETHTQTLSVENKTNNQVVFVQSGEIVKGGQQDRMMANDLLIAPSAYLVPATVFCVEKERSFQRGSESFNEFNSATQFAPTLTLKRAVRDAFLSEAPPTEHIGTSNGATAPSDATPSQEDAMLHTLSVPQQLTWNENDPHQITIWNEVGNIQKTLGERMGDSVKSPASPSSLDLTLENERVQRTVDSSSQLLNDHLTNDAVGVIYLINGSLEGAEWYNSSKLFRELWPSLLSSFTINAMVEPQTSSIHVSSSSDYLLSLINQPLTHATFQKDLNVRTRILSFDLPNANVFETDDIGADDVIAQSQNTKYYDAPFVHWIHRSFLFK